ncbi:hypothetical protein ACFVXG_39945 [Kitasatospora sp. NPDC058162]|uniref:hypothetical protein n=1 Tax=Kitasatospora sp. NPDC058162 TaxID=3346362 RepID=UPI0036DB1824
MRNAIHIGPARSWPGKVVTAAAVAITALTLNACSAMTSQEQSKPTMTVDQAKKLIDGYQGDILANLSIKPTSNPTSFSDLECDANNSGPHGRKQTWRSATFESLPLSGRTEAADAFRSYLTGRGFQLVEPDARLGWVKMKNPKDNFVAILGGATDASRTFQLDVISPCLWPNGTPPPA